MLLYIKAMAWRLSKPKPKCSLVIAFAVGYSYIEG